MIIIRNIKKNKQTFWYANFISIVDILDDNGFYTGEKAISYTKPQIMTANISGARGESEATVFGINTTDYDRVIAMMKTDMDESSILWIDKEPELEPDGTLALYPDGRQKTPHNHIVRRLSRSLNSVLIAVQAVSVS